MKIKRIALLLCFCILASSLCSCTLIQRFISSHRNDESEQHEPTAREIFFDSLKAAFPKSENESSPEIKKRDYDSKERATLKFEKLDINGDPIIDSDLLMDIQAQYDADSEILKSDTVFKYKDEQPTFSTVSFDGKTVCYDYFGITIRPTLIDGSIYDSDFDTSSISEAIDFGAAYTRIAGSLKAALDNNIDESLYTSEQADTVINEKEYKNATIITFTCVDGVMRRIAHEFFDGLEQDEAFNTLFESTELDETIISTLDDVREFRIKNTVVDNKSVALAIELTVLKDGVRVTYAIHASYPDTEKGYEIIIGTIGANREISQREEWLSIKYEKGDIQGGTAEERFVVKNFVLYDTFTLFELNGKANESENQRFGTATYKNGLSYISFDYSLKLGESEGFIDISNFRKAKGAELGERFNIALQYTKKEAQSQLSIDFDIATETEIGDIAVLGSINTAEIKEDVTLTAPTVYDPALTYGYYNRQAQDQSPEFFGIFDRITNALMGNLLETDFEFDIDLPSDFVYYKEDDWDASYSSDYAFIAVKRHGADSFSNFEDLSTKHFAENRRQGYGSYSPSLIESINDVYYFSFDYESNGTECTALECILKGEDAFWELQIGTHKQLFEQYVDDFIKWSQSVTVPGREGIDYDQYA